MASNPESVCFQVVGVVDNKRWLKYRLANPAFFGHERLGRSLHEQISFQTQTCTNTVTILGAEVSLGWIDTLLLAFPRFE